MRYPIIAVSLVGLALSLLLLPLWDVVLPGCATVRVCQPGPASLFHPSYWPAWLGVGGFLVLMGLAWFQCRTGLRITAFAGMVVALGFATVAVITNRPCLYCLLTHLCSYTIAGLAAWDYGK